MEFFSSKCRYGSFYERSENNDYVDVVLSLSSYGSEDAGGANLIKSFI